MSVGPARRPATDRTAGPIADTFLRAVGLTVLVAIPLYFNTESLDSFERDKAALLRFLALLMLAAWGMKAVSWRPKGGTTGRAEAAVLALAVLLLLEQALATAMSIAPRISLLGDYHRMQGLYTAAAYFVVFLSLATALRERRHIVLAVDVLLLVSAPVALYGLLQRHGLDPLTWGQSSRSPVLSTMGNEIFVPAFLIMIVPLTVYRLVDATTQARTTASVGRRLAFGCAFSLIVLLAGWWESAIGGILATLSVLAIWVGLGLLPGWRSGACTAVAAFLILLSLQLSCIAFSESRGPFLGLLVGLGLLGLLAGAIYGHRKAVLAVIVLGLALLSCLIAINIPGSPLGSVSGLPVVGRLTDVFTAEGTARIRLLIWSSVLQLLAGDPWRLLVGYGPDTIRLALQPHYDSALAPLAAGAPWPDRAHNDTLDWLATTGIAGFAAYLMLLAAVISLALRTLGIRAVHGRAPRPVPVLVSLVILGAATLRLATGSWQFIGLALPAGLLIGLVGYVLRFSLSRPPQQPCAHGAKVSPLLPAALVAALIAHVVETHVGIATVSTRLAFWVLCALVVAGARLPEPTGSRPPERARQIAPPGPASGILAAAFLAALTLGFDFARTGTEGSVSLQFTWLFAVTFVVLAPIVLWCSSSGGPASAVRWLETFGFYGAACLAGLLLARLASGGAAMGSADGPSAFAMFAGLLAGSAILYVTALVPPAWPVSVPAGFRCAMLLTLAGVTLWLGWITNVDLVRADEAAKDGWQAQQRQDDAEAVTAFRRAVQIAPAQDHYHGLLGIALSRQAVAAEPGQRDRLFTAAKDALERALELSPGDAEHLTNLARLHGLWARQAQTAAQRHGHRRRAAALYAMAVEASPGRPRLWLEWGVSLTTLGRTDDALRKLERARTLHSGLFDVYPLLGEAYARREDWSSAREALERAVELRSDLVTPRVSLASVYVQLGRHEDAMRLYRQALSEQPRMATARRALVVLHLHQRNCRLAEALIREGAGLGWDDTEVRAALRNRCGGTP